MARPQLRIYYGPDEQVTPTMPAQQTQQEAVTVPLRDVFPLLADAVQSERTWLEDFSDDEVTIPADLYDVLLAYEHYRRPSA